MYRVLRNPDVKPSEAATVKRYSRLEDAFADMGEGVVVNDLGQIVAFHERHLRLLTFRG